MLTVRNNHLYIASQQSYRIVYSFVAIIHKSRLTSRRQFENFLILRVSTIFGVADCSSRIQPQLPLKDQLPKVNSVGNKYMCIQVDTHAHARVQYIIYNYNICKVSSNSIRA